MLVNSGVLCKWDGREWLVMFVHWCDYDSSGKGNQHFCYIFSKQL